MVCLFFLITLFFLGFMFSVGGFFRVLFCLFCFVVCVTEIWRISCFSGFSRMGNGFFVCVCVNLFRLFIFLVL